MAKLPDFITAENELDGQEHVYIAQGGKTRKTLLQKIKEFVIGTATMGTTATDITGAIAEHTSQLNDIMNERGYVNTKIITGLDLNTIIKSGIYAGDNLINTPQNDVWYTLEVFNCSNDDYVIQRLMGFADGGTGTFERRKNNTKWTEWQRIATTEYVDNSMSNQLTPTLLASGTFSTGNTITLSQNITNFSKLIFTYGDGGSETEIHLSWSYPSVFATPFTFKGVTTFGNYEVSTTDGITLTVTSAGTKYFRKVYGLKV